MRIGSHIEVAGTTAALPDGGAVDGDDIAEQTREAIRRIIAALAEVGARPEDVIRTRMFVTDIDRWEEIGGAHGDAAEATRGGHLEAPGGSTEAPGAELASPSARVRRRCAAPPRG